MYTAMLLIEVTIEFSLRYFLVHTPKQYWRQNVTRLLGYRGVCTQRPMFKLSPGNMKLKQNSSVFLAHAAKQSHTKNNQVPNIYRLNSPCNVITLTNTPVEMILRPLYKISWDIWSSLVTKFRNSDFWSTKKCKFWWFLDSFKNVGCRCFHHLHNMKF